MKKALSILFALILMCCAVISVSAKISPTAPPPDNYITIDVVAVPSEGGSTIPGFNNPGKVEINSGETITLTATPSKGYKFSHWDFIYGGDYEIVEGSLTTPTLVIRPTGTSDMRVEAHFVKKDEPVTPPASKPITTLSPDDTSPVTGTQNTAAISIVSLAVVAVTIGAAVILKKKSNA